MNIYYENNKKSIWARLEHDCDIDELIYGTHQTDEEKTTEENSDR